MFNECTTIVQRRALTRPARSAGCKRAFMLRPPVAIGAEDGRVQVERLPTTQAGWAAAAVRGAQQAALSPMLKRREQMPLTEGRSSGGMREKPSRLYGAKTCSSSSMSAGSPSTVASSDASSPAPCDQQGVWLSPLATLPRERARARVGAVQRGRSGQGLEPWPGPRSTP